MLARSVHDRSHPFLKSEILSVETDDACIGLGPLQLSIDQVVVLEVAGQTIRPRDVVVFTSPCRLLAPRPHLVGYLVLRIRRTHPVVDHCPLVIDRYPNVAPDRLVAAGEAGLLEQPGAHLHEWQDELVGPNVLATVVQRPDTRISESIPGLFDLKDRVHVDALHPGVIIERVVVDER